MRLKPVKVLVFKTGICLIVKCLFTMQAKLAYPQSTMKTEGELQSYRKKQGGTTTSKYKGKELNLQVGNRLGAALIAQQIITLAQISSITLRL